MPLYPFIGAECGREMTNDGFSKLALRLFPSDWGATDLTFYPVNDA